MDLGHETCRRRARGDMPGTHRRAVSRNWPDMDSPPIAPATIMARPDPRRPVDVRTHTHGARFHSAAFRSPVMLLFASDIHLSAHRPDAVAAFADFLAGPVRSAERLYLLGDVFDLWLGDDDDRAPHPEVEAALADTVSAGVPVDLIRGNHDFLLGGAFAARTGCRLVDEPHVIEVMDERAVLLHGDMLCTRDVEYQAFRRYARNPGNQRAFLARPMEERAREAAKIRATSNSRTRRTSWTSPATRSCGCSRSALRPG